MHFVGTATILSLFGHRKSLNGRLSGHFCSRVVGVKQSICRRPSFRTVELLRLHRLASIFTIRLNSEPDRELDDEAAFN